MAAEPVPHLRLVRGTAVDADSGEHVGCDDCAPTISALQQQVEMLERELQGKRLAIAKLERDKEKEARDHPAYNDIKELHDYYRKACKHPRERFDGKRFWLALPMWDKDGKATCYKAVEGAAFDPYITSMRNGKQERHDGWDLIFKSRKQFYAFCRRAPYQPTASELSRLASERLAAMPDDDRATDDRIAQAVDEARAMLREQGRA